MQAGHYTCLTFTIDSWSIAACCLSETRIQDSSSVIQLAAAGISSWYFLCTSGDEENRAVCQCGVGIVLTDKTEAARFGLDPGERSFIWFRTPGGSR
ncbi:hypothetical protein D915_010686, partial [Fasciola hepatica]